MSSVRILPGSADLVQAVLEEMHSHGSNFSRNAVVFQGKRPAHFLRKAIARAQGSAYFPPHTFSMDRFVDYLFDTVVRSPKNDMDSLDAIVELYELQTALHVKLGGDPGESMEHFLPLGRRLFSALEELLIEQVSPGRLASAVLNTPGQEQHALHRLFEAFYPHVKAMGKSTRAMRFARVAEAAEGITLAEFDKVIFAGFFAFSRSEQSMIRALARLDHVAFLYLDGPGLRENIPQSNVRALFPDPAPREASLRLSTAPDLHGQVGALAQELSTLRTAGVELDERSVIVLPSADALFPLVEWALPCLGGIPHNISLGYPVRRTPLYAFLRALMQVVAGMESDRVHVTEYVRFLLHPYVKNIVWHGTPETTRILAHTIEEELAKQGSRTFMALREFVEDRTLCAQTAFRLSHAGFDIPAEEVARHLAHLHEYTFLMVRRADTIAGCTEAIARVLSFLDESSTAPSHPLFRSFEDAILDRLQEIAKSRLREIRLATPSQYWSIISACLEESVVPFEGTPVEGVQVLGFLETRNLRFDRVFMLDVNDDVIPGNERIDIFLPATLRRTLGLPEQVDHDAVAEYWFTSLVRSAREVHLFFREGGKKEKSRFLERLIWEWQQRDDTTATAPYIQPIEYSVRVALPKPEPIRKTASMVAQLQRSALSASALDAYLRCPLQFFYKYALHLGEAASVTDDIERDEIGKMVHSILMRLFAPLVGTPLTPDRLDENTLREVVRGVFAEEYGSEIAGPRLLLMEQTTQHLEQFLVHYQKEILQTTEIHLVGLEMALQMTRHGVTLKGRADRVERRGEVVHLLDYKTGSNTATHRVRLERVDFNDRTTWKSHVGSLQLPLYSLMYAEAHGLPADRIVPSYVYLGKNTLDMSIEESPFKDSLLPEERMRRVDRLVGELVGEILSLEVPFVRTDAVDRDCPTCPFVRLCGTRWAQT